MKPLTVALVLGLWIGIGVDSTRAADEPVVVVEPDAEKPKEFKPPPGFITKKRGKYVLYCKREAPMGTRLKTETCLDEAQMRDYVLALAENKRDVDRIRAICSNPCVCGDPSAC